MNEKEILSIATKANSNANLLKDLLKDEFPIVTDKNGNVSHELIVKTDFFQKHNITDMELCKRLIDYGYHPPKYLKYLRWISLYKHTMIAAIR